MKIRIGFVPSHREPFDENWAIEMRRRTLSTLSKIENLEIVVPNEDITQNGLLRNDIEAEDVVRLFREKKIDGIIIGTMTFGDEISSLHVASKFRDKPILLFGTKEAPFTDEGSRHSDAFCGTLSISSGLHRRKIPFIFAGIIFPEDEVFLNNIDEFIRICSITKGFLGAKIGLVGPRPERFETCIFSEDSMIKQFNQRVLPISLLDIVNQIENLNDNSRVSEIIQEIKKEADISEVSEESITKIAKLEYILKKFAEERNLSGMGIQCWTAMQEVYGVSPCFAMGRLTQQGIMTSCEVDVYGSLTMLMQYLGTLGTAPPHFVDWTIRHQKKENVFLSWHCGNAPPKLACVGCKIRIREHDIMKNVLDPKICQGTAEFQLKPGIVTLSRLVEYDGKFKMLITRGEIEESNEEIRGSWCWVKVDNLDYLYRKLVEEGFIHHASLVHGDYVKVLASVCKFLKIEPVII